MAITVDRLEYAISEAERFLKLAKNMENSYLATRGKYETGKLPAAVKRASMDLTRALAELRK